MTENEKAGTPPQPPCIRCGATDFFDTPMVDPKAGLTFHLYRCRACDNRQWSPGLKSSAAR